MSDSSAQVTPRRDGIWVEIKAKEQWVCWKEVIRDGDPTKVPVDAGTGGAASTTDPETWSDFETAWEHYESHDGIDGIGFVFTEDDQITGIDLDDCRDPETGEIEPWALDIIRTLKSPTEVSPSGTGIHIYAFGSVPEGGNRRDGVEMYDVERYFTVTGERPDEHDVGSLTWRQDEIETVHEGHVYSESTATAADVDFTIRGRFEERPEYTNELDESLEEIRDRDDRLDYLLDNIEADYESASEADMAAATKLWFWRFSPQDIADIIRQFRARPKVIERDDYLELTISKVAAGEQYEPRRHLDETVEILGDRDTYSSIDEAELPDGNFVLDKPPREGGSHASIQHLLGPERGLVVLVSRHKIAEHHIEILGEMLPDGEAAVHMVGRRRACDHAGKEQCPKAPSDRDEVFDLEDEVIDILYRKQSVTIDDCPDRLCKYSFIQACAEEAHAVVTVPQLFPRLERDFEGDNLLVDEEQALGYFRPGSTELIQIAQTYEPDGTRAVQQVSSNISTQLTALESVRGAVEAEQEKRQEKAEEEDRSWRRTSTERDIVNAVDYVEEISEELGVTDVAEELEARGKDVTAKAVIDELMERLDSIERPEPRTSPEDFRGKLAEFTAPFFHRDGLDPGAFIESVLFPYDERPFDFKKTGRGHTLRMVGGREVFHADDLREFEQIGVIAGPEGEMLFDDMGLDAKTILIDDFRYAEDFVVVPVGKEIGGELEGPSKQRRRARKVSKMLNDRVHPHMAVAGTKDRAAEHHAELDVGLSNVVGNPDSPAKDMRTLWSAGETAIIYQNSAVSRGVDVPFFDISVVVSTGFATPYWEARAKHYRGEDDDEYLHASAVESQLKARELTNAVLRTSPTWGTEEYCGTKFIVASDWDAQRLKYLHERMLPRFAYAENAANFIEQLTIGGGLRHTIDEVYDEVGGNERKFIEVAMEEELTETVRDRPSFTLEELTTWRENNTLTSGDEEQTMKKVVPFGGGPVTKSDIRNVLGSSWSGTDISAALSVLGRKGLFEPSYQKLGKNGSTVECWEWNV